jgi:hypothetical protein
MGIDNTRQRRGPVRVLAAVILAILVSASAYALDRFAQITIDNTAGGVSLPATLIDPANAPQATLATCRARTAEISITYDGTAPTTTVGQLLEPGDWFTLSGHNRLFLFRAIRTGATSGQLDCTATP